LKNLVLLFLLFVFQFSFSQLVAAKYSINNIRVNTKYSDYGTSYFGPNRIIFASNYSDAKKNRGNNSKNDNTPKYDLFKGMLNYNGEINSTKKILNNFTTKYNESNVSFTPDLKYVYFTQNNLKKGKYIKDDSNWINLKLYRAQIMTNGDWENIVSLPFNDDSFSCAHPSVSEDGKILFFTSDMPGSYGQSDIYWVTILKNGKYGIPQNLGLHVNSEARENFPFVDGNILYFSSDRSDTKGGLDVYMVEIDHPNSTPTNIGLPINSKDDDFCFVINREKRTGFFSSNRAKGKGSDDIYTFVQKTEIVSCQQIVSGVIRDQKTNNILSGATVSLYSHKNILLATYPTKEDGKFTFKLACRGNYRIEANKLDYEKAFKEIDYIPNTNAQEINLQLKSIKKPEPVAVVKTIPVSSEKAKNIEKEIDEKPSYYIEKNGKLILDIEPIYFVLDESYITKKSGNTLEKVADIIKNNPNIIIEFGTHTDCRASDSYNLHLSNLRAKEVISYLTKQLNIPKHRISGRGYGESQLANHCKDGVKCTEAEHLQNRRTEFVIIKI